MSLIDFADEIENNFVNDLDGLARDITYAYRTGLLVETRAFVEDGDYRKKSDDVIEDTTSFLSVKLPSSPKKGDVILYNDTRWYVDSFRGDSLFDVVCKSNRSHTTSRQKKGF